MRGGTARVWSADHCCGSNRPGFDGYAPGEALNADDAFAYHCEQAETLAQRNVDLLYAPTFPALSELHGAARAMAQTGRPYALAPMLHPDGTMLDGTTLAGSDRVLSMLAFPGTAALHDRLPLSHARAIGTASACVPHDRISSRAFAD